MRRVSVAIALVAGAAASLAACSTADAEITGACVDWVVFDTPTDAAADASSIVIGTVGDQVGTTRVYENEVSVWSFDVESWVSGSGEDTIEIASSPETCSVGSPYPDGDPLDVDGRVMVLLHEQVGVRRTITPWQGVIALPRGDEVPAEWPAGTAP